MRKVILVLILLVFAGSVYALEIPSRIVVNHTTKECATFWIGDGSQRCYLPTGWEILDQGYDTSLCPEDYSVLENELKGDCSLIGYGEELNDGFIGKNDEANNLTMLFGGLGIGIVLVVVVILGFFIYFFMRKKRSEF